MIESEFIAFWQNEYPEAFPIGHELKWIYPERWLRIHSLPHSMRYSDSEIKYQIILERQNHLITDLVGIGSELIFLIGFYQDNDLVNSNYRLLTDFNAFQKVWTIDLKKERPQEHEEELYLDVLIKSENWEMKKKDDLLRRIADDEIRALIISPSNKCIVAPYDGGVDVIVDSSTVRDYWEKKYHDWLSDQDDGL